MNRRGLLLGAGSTLLAQAKTDTQQADRLYRLGILMGSVQEANSERNLAAARTELARLGWTEGRNLRIDLRWGAGSFKRLQGYAAELVALGPDAILAAGLPAVDAARAAAGAVPIIFNQIADPIAAGVVESLAHPGGNITGFAAFDYSLDGKWVEFLKQVAPQTKRIAPIGNPETVRYGDQFKVIEAAGRALGVEVVPAPYRDRDEAAAAIVAIAREPGGGLIFLLDNSNNRYRGFFLDLITRLRLPATQPASFIVRLGGLISYGVDLIEQYRDSASYIDRILRGARPADLPVQRPTKFELAINLKTAKALGLTVPQSLLVRADDVIE